MLNDKEMNRLHKEIFRDHHIIRTGVDINVDINIIKEIKQVTDTAKTMSKSDWEKWYDRNKDSFPVLLAGLQTHLVPKSVTKQIINNFDMFKNPYRRGCVIEDERLLQAVIANDIHLYDLENVASKMDKDFIYVLEFYSKNIENNKKYLESIPEDVKIFIAKKALKEFSVAGIPYSNSTIQILNFIQDESALRKIFFEDKIELPISFTNTQAENVRTELINNTYLSNEFKDEMFSAGCHWLRLKADSFTPNMISEIYESCIDTYTELYDKTTKRPKRGWEFTYRESQDMISKLLKSGKMPESMQVDLAMRIIGKENKKMDYDLQELFQQTKSENILKMAENIKSKDKNYAYENPHMPKDILEKRANNLCEKMTKFLVKGTPEKIPTIWDDYIQLTLMRTKIEDEHYKMLIANGQPLSQIAIATSEFTPEYIKKDFLTFLNVADEREFPKTYQPQVKTALEVLDFIKKENLEEMRPFVAKYFNKIGPFTSEINFSNNNGRGHYQVGRAIELIDNMCKITSRENIEKLIEFCRIKAGDAFITPKEETYKDKEKNIYKFFFHTLNTSLKYTEILKEYEKTKDASILPDDILQNILWTTKRKAINETDCVQYYLTLAEDGEEILNLIDEAKKREYEKEKSLISSFEK